MKHTDLITDKDAGYVENTGDRHYFANALTLISYNLERSINIRQSNLTFRKVFLNHLNILIKYRCK